MGTATRKRLSKRPDVSSPSPHGGRGSNGTFLMITPVPIVRNGARWNFPLALSDQSVRRFLLYTAL